VSLSLSLLLPLPLLLLSGLTCDSIIRVFGSVGTANIACGAILIICVEFTDDSRMEEVKSGLVPRGAGACLDDDQVGSRWTVAFR